MSIALTIFAIAWLLFGTLSGSLYSFLRSGQAAMSAGELIRKEHFLVRLITMRGDTSLSGGQAFSFLLFLGIWLVLFFGSFFGPLSAYEWLPSQNEMGVFVGYTAIALGWLLGKPIGKHLWYTLS